MTDERTFTAKIDEHGRFPDHVRNAIGVVMRGYSGKVVKVSLKLQSLRRSSKQNSYYWSVIIPHWKMIFREGGTYQTDDDVHEFLVREVAKLQRPLIGPDGQPVKRYTKLEEKALDLIDRMLDFMKEEDVENEWSAEAKELIEHASEMTPPVMVAVSTGDLSTKEYSEFTELCRATAATEHGHDIPPPDPDYKERKDQ